MDNFQQIFMLLTAYKNNETNHNYFQYLIIIFVLYELLSKINFFQRMNEWIDHFSIRHKKMVSIKIVSHKIPFTKSFSHAITDRQIFSDDFKAILYHLLSNNMNNIDSLTEIIIDSNQILKSFDHFDNNNENENDLYKNKDNRFSYIPLLDKEILLSEELDIYCIVKYNEDDFINEKTNKNNQNMNINMNMNTNTNTKDIKVITSQKNYLIILFTYKSKMPVLRSYLDTITEKYNKFIEYNNSKKKEKCIYDYTYFEKESGEKIKLYYDQRSLNNVTKNFNNLVLPNKEKLINSLLPFINQNTDVHYQKIIDDFKLKCIKTGRPNKFGALLYGPPGTGKSSIITCIAKLLNRNLVYYHINESTTCEELNAFFYNKKYENRMLEPHEIIIVFEDFNADHMSYLKSRDLSKDDLLHKTKEYGEFIHLSKMNEFNKNVTSISKEDNKKLTLSYFLKMIDSLPDEIVYIFTDNNISEIDPAFIRPGRFTYILEVKKATKEMIKEMLRIYFDLSKNQIDSYDHTLNIKDYVLSTAEVEQICSLYDENIDECISQIVLKSQEK